tara:strand:+ start:1262 stop:1480 length:219 start_codon:yes stop_codon:yes gene_type:complete
MSMVDAQSLIDSMLRGVMIAGVNRAVFKGQPVFSMGTVNEGVRLGAASVAYDVAVRPVVKSVLPQLPLPNGK